MPRAPKKCGHPGCDNRVVARTWCPTHVAQHQRRASTTARGYGQPHQALRAHWQPIVAAGNATCWRCGHKIKPDEQWHLGHDDNDRSITRGPEHARRCNLAAAGHKTRSTRTFDNT